jgi:hypothetical protein
MKKDPFHWAVLILDLLVAIKNIHKIIFRLFPASLALPPYYDGEKAGENCQSVSAKGCGAGFGLSG